MVTPVEPSPEPSETLTDPRELLTGYLDWYREWGFAGERVDNPDLEFGPAGFWQVGHLDVARELADGTVGQ